MSEVKVNKISPRTNCGTVQLGDSGDTITIPAGATITNNGTAAGFGSTGEISWDTTPKTASFTGVSGVGYFVNTASGAITVTLPASPSSGNVVGVSDYNSTASTNSITIARNGSNINGSTSNITISKANSAIQFVYVDATTGWQTVFTGNTGDVLNTALVATGGTESTCGDFKIHTFTGPGTFTVTNAASGACAPNNVVSYLVIAGGASGATGDRTGGGGAGGFREYKSPVDTYSASPANGNPGGTSITVTAQAYPITVGGGGAGAVYAGSALAGNDGNNSIFSTITSTGGGGGGGTGNGRPGGSGGGGYHNNASGGSGNTPPVSPSQGNNGGSGNYCVNAGSGGGGGAGAVGQNAAGQPVPGRGGDGGNGLATSITGSSVTRAGGGGGSGDQGPRSGGSGGGGAAGPPGSSNGVSGTTNTGSGGGDTGNSSSNPGATSGAGGSGIVVIRYKFQ